VHTASLQRTVAAYAPLAIASSGGGLRSSSAFLDAPAGCTSRHHIVDGMDFALPDLVCASLTVASGEVGEWVERVLSTHCPEDGTVLLLCTRSQQHVALQYIQYMYWMYSST
jgi:hypothetical protein